MYIMSGTEGESAWSRPSPYWADPGSLPRSGSVERQLSRLRDSVCERAQGHRPEATSWRQAFTIVHVPVVVVVTAMAVKSPLRILVSFLFSVPVQAHRWPGLTVRVTSITRPEMVP